MKNLYRCQGLGSFVSDHQTHQSFAELKDFEKELSGSGLQVSSIVISFQQEKATPEICSYLGVRENGNTPKLAINQK